MRAPFEVRTGKGTAEVLLRGRLGAPEAASLHRRLGELAADVGVSRVVLDFSRVRAVGTPALAVISLARRRLEEEGRDLEVTHLRGAARRFFEGVEAAAAPTPEDRGMHVRLGARVSRAGEAILRVSELAVDAALRAPGAVFKRRRPPHGSVIEQAVFTGVEALPIVALLSLLVGVVLAFQAIHQLRQFGAQIFVVDIVGLGMILEFGPLITAIILAGRTGAAIAAELGTMSVQSEVDALRSMGLDPVRLLVVPRMAALLLVQPALTVLATAIGILGGLVVATSLGISAPIYLYRLAFTVVPGDLLVGLVKAFVFAWLVGFIACYAGLRARGGAESVGRVTTRAVVATIFFVIVADSLLTTAITVIRG